MRAAARAAARLGAGAVRLGVALGCSVGAAATSLCEKAFVRLGAAGTVRTPRSCSDSDA